MIKKVYGDACHEYLAKEVKGKLSFDENADFETYKKTVRNRLRKLLGMDKFKGKKCPLDVDIEETVETEAYVRIRFTYESEPHCVVPAYLFLPKQGKETYPVAICLQGHTTGVHISLGEKRFPRDEKYTQQDFGLQAVENGFAALCIEQRAMGERRSPRAFEDTLYFDRPHACAVNTLTAFQLGRTTIGERVWDVQRGIDALGYFKQLGLDLHRIMIIGNSGGGTATFYAGCLEERITYVAPACSFCSFKTSTMDIEHCACNFIPDICNWFEMEDLSCLIAPRRFTVFAGVLDPIFPITGVRESYKVVEKIYKKAGVKDHCRLVEMPKDHWFCAEIIWPVVKEETAQVWNEAVCR